MSINDPAWFRDLPRWQAKRHPRRVHRIHDDRTDLLIDAVDNVRSLAPISGVYGDGRHGAVEFIDDIFVLMSSIQATTIVIDDAWLKAPSGGGHGLVLRATESITIRNGGCLLTGMGNAGESASGGTPGGLDPDSGFGFGGGGAGNGTAGGNDTEGLGLSGVDQLSAHNLGGWSAPNDIYPTWNEAYPQQGGNGGTTGGVDTAVVGGMSRGTCSPVSIMDYLMRGITNGFPLAVGGCGGAAGNCDGVGVAGAGGQGGGGGSPIVLAAPRIIFEAGAYVERDVTGGPGGDGGDAVGGSCGGGGGGAGGNCAGIFDITESWEVGDGVTIEDHYTSGDGRAVGGANGAGSGSGTSGSEGSPGLNGRTYLINPATMTFINRD